MLGGRNPPGANVLLSTLVRGVAWARPPTLTPFRAGPVGRILAGLRHAASRALPHARMRSNPAQCTEGQPPGFAERRLSVLLGSPAVGSESTFRLTKLRIYLLKFSSNQGTVSARPRR